MAQSNKGLLFFLILIISYLILTNTHFSYEQTLKFGGADGLSYISISEDAPYIVSKKIMLIHAERFFFPYIIGIISNLIKIDIFYIYKVFVFITLFMINFYIYKIHKYLKHDNDLILCTLSLINFNPYISRYYISVPTIINDLIFILGITMIIYYIVRKKNNLFEIILAYLFCFGSRQSSLAIIISYIITKIKTKKNLLNFKEIVIGFFLFVIFLFMIKYYTDNISTNLANDRSEYYSFNMRFLGIFFQETSIYNKLKFLCLPLLSYFGLIIFFILFLEIKKKNLKNIFKLKLNIFLFSLILLLILQPVLSGPNVTGRNIIRLTTLAYIPSLFFLLIISNKIKKITFKKQIIFYFLLFIQSMHPTFSNIKIFEFLKF